MLPFPAASRSWYFGRPGLPASFRLASHACSRRPEHGVTRSLQPPVPSLLASSPGFTLHHSAPNPACSGLAQLRCARPLMPTVRLAYAPASSCGSLRGCCSASASRYLLGSTISVRRRPSLRPIGRVTLPVPAPRPPGRSWPVVVRRSPARFVSPLRIALSDRRHSSTLRFTWQPRRSSSPRAPKSQQCAASAPSGPRADLGGAELLRTTPLGFSPHVLRALCPSASTSETPRPA